MYNLYFMIYFKVVIKMSFDGVFLHKLLGELNSIKTGRITKIMESGDTDFIFTIRADKTNYHLLFSFSCDFARIHFTTKRYDFPSNPKSLTMFLRKHIEGYFIEDIYQYNNDRILVFKLTGYNELRDYTQKYLICEFMGRYSNMLLTDENYRILEVLKHAGVSEFGRTMLPNATYVFPTTTKMNPFKLTLEELEALQISSPKELCIKLEGISMNLASYVYTKERAIPFFYELLHKEIEPCIYKQANEKKEYYYIPLGEKVYSFSSCSAMLDAYYYDMDNQAKIKAKTNDLERVIERQIIKNEKKLKKLELESIDASSAMDYKIKGDLLLSYPHLKSKEQRVEVYDYYNQKNIMIELDPKYDIITNSQRYYKKYQKMKTAVHYIQDQMNFARNEIEYFKILSEQLKCASIHDALEIQQELIENHYIFKEEGKAKRKAKPNYLTYLIEDTEIFVGKNNLQNEYLTHKLARGTDFWFHVQNASGSHVIVATNELTEELCRSAAMLAASYSSLKNSSSIPVDYTQVKNIKKIPGKRNCFVTYTKQKTIYIDIDPNKVEGMKLKK